MGGHRGGRREGAVVAVGDGGGEELEEGLWVVHG
jgi:hypothetical protein